MEFFEKVIQAVEYFTEEVRILLEMLHGKAKDEAWNNQVKEKLSPSLQEEVSFKDAAWPSPFVPGLEYNSPAHGPWNIVHMGMLLPGAHQIYVCGANCNRGVILTAAEMNAGDRFSFVEIKEEDLFNGQMEELVIEGVSDILHKLPEKPSVVLLFTVCVHHFMGCDLTYIYDTLRERFPEQCFVDCYMDPIMQKEGLTPDQKLRAGLYKPLPMREKNLKQINIIGNDFPTREETELKRIAKEAGYTVKDITECKTYDEYLSMAESYLNIACYPPAKYGAEQLSKRLGMKFLYLPFSFNYNETDVQLKSLVKEMPGCEMPDTSLLQKKCERMLKETKTLVGDTPITIDATVVPRFLGLTKLLITHGFSVVKVFADGFLAEEKADYLWLKKNAPDLKIGATIHPNMRVCPRNSQEKVLAIGQKAAYFSGTEHFVNMVEGGGLHGYDGICELCLKIQEAYQTKKDTRDLIVRKGLGCESCV